jgi:hypothetical protein
VRLQQGLSNRWAFLFEKAGFYLARGLNPVTEIYSHLQPEQMHNAVNRIQESLN